MPLLGFVVHLKVVLRKQSLGSVHTRYRMTIMGPSDLNGIFLAHLSSVSIHIVFFFWAGKIA